MSQYRTNFKYDGLSNQNGLTIKIAALWKANIMSKLWNNS
jgi:hypothetical protein